MGDATKISWCDSTVNFWSGCTKVSPGCANCYAETLSNRKMTDARGNLTIGQWGKGAPRRIHESAFDLAEKLNRKPWVCDNANLFDWPDGVSLEAAGEAFASCKPRFTHPKGGDPAEWPEDLRVRQWPAFTF